MNKSDSDIVITGLGAVSALGAGIDPLWEAAVAGKTGIEVVRFDHPEYPHEMLLAQIKNFEAKEYVKPRKALKVMAPEIQAGFSAAVMATQQSGIEAGVIDPDRLGVVFGCEIIFSESGEANTAIEHSSPNGTMDFSKWGQCAKEKIYPLWMLKSLPNMVACHVGIALDARGPNNTITTEETAAMVGLMEAISVIQRGQADVMVVGAAGNRTSSSRLIQRIDSNFTHDVDNGPSACRPMDASRSGSVAGEASGVIVIEKREHAVARGATPICTIAGWANVFHPVESPRAGSSQAVQRAIHTSLAKSGCSIEDVDFLNAAAGGSVTLDATECSAIRESGLTAGVNSFKSIFGDSGSSSAIVELCLTAKSIEQGIAPATLFHQETAADCPVNVLFGDNYSFSPRLALKTSLTPHGHATCIALTPA